MKTTSITIKRNKTFNEISIQCERISTLYLKGYGTDKMLQKCENIYMKIVAQKGY